MWLFIFFAMTLAIARDESRGVGKAILFFMALAILGVLLGNLATWLFPETGAR
jgi:NhaP-type Na+/H+ or K+/H+ antiporter